jgi:uncharacterized coiled-coil DUF342 family protein
MEVTRTQIKNALRSSCDNRDRLIELIEKLTKLEEKQLKIEDSLNSISEKIDKTINKTEFDDFVADLENIIEETILNKSSLTPRIDNDLINKLNDLESKVNELYSIRNIRSAEDTTRPNVPKLKYLTKK